VTAAGAVVSAVVADRRLHALIAASRRIRRPAIRRAIREL
jgi:hypothetical protein